MEVRIEKTYIVRKQICKVAYVTRNLPLLFASRFILICRLIVRQFRNLVFIQSVFVCMYLFSHFVLFPLHVLHVFIRSHCELHIIYMKNYTSKILEFQDIMLSQQVDI